MALDGLVTAECGHGAKETFGRLVVALPNCGTDKKPLWHEIATRARARHSRLREDCWPWTLGLCLYSEIDVISSVNQTHCSDFTGPMISAVL